MFAIVKTGGKQYKVVPNDVIQVEKLACATGDAVEFKDVLLLGQGNSIKVGKPFIAEAKVRGTVVDQIRDDKVIIFKKKRRHNYRRKNGHRQYLTIVRITDILPEGKELKTTTPPAKTEEMAKTIEKAPKVKAQIVKASPKQEASPKEAPVKKPAAKPKKSPKA